MHKLNLPDCMWFMWENRCVNGPYADSDAQEEENGTTFVAKYTFEASTL